MNIAIIGYGRLGRAAEVVAEHFSGVRVLGVFTRRAVDSLTTVGAPVYSESSLDRLVSEVDCALVCRGSSADTPAVTPRLAELCCTVDSYDCHGDIARHRSAVDRAARLGGNASLVSVGWDPGLFSLLRIYAAAFMPQGVTNTFWGRGVSQGHSEAIRRIKGVIRAVQYTEPRSEAVTLAESGVRLSDTERHKRICCVVCDKADEEGIAAEIRSLDGYFCGYETEVNFISEAEFDENHGGARHGGRVLSVGRTGLYRENLARLDFSLALDSNPEFTAGVRLSAAIAAVRLKKEGRHGAYTLADIPPSYLLPRGKSELELM